MEGSWGKYDEVAGFGIRARRLFSQVWVGKHWKNARKPALSEQRLRSLLVEYLVWWVRRL